MVTKKHVAPKKLMDEPTKPEATFVEVSDYLDYVSSRLKYLDAKVVALKTENAQLKSTIKQMERRLMAG